MTSGPLFDAGAAARSGFSGRDLIRLVFKHLWVILGCTLVVGAISVYGALRQPQLYTATAQVWVKTERQGTPSFLSGVTAYREATSQDPPNRRIETEMSLLLNRSSIERVVRKFDLSPDQLKRKPLTIAVEPLTLFIDDLRKRLGIGNQDLVDPLSETVKVFNDSVAMEPLRSKGADTTSDVIEIKLTGTDRGLTQAALADLLNEYVSRGSSQNTELGQQALKALRSQATGAQADLASAENAIINYAVGTAAATLTGDPPKPGGDLSGSLISTGSTVAGNPSVPTVTAKLRSDMHQLQAQLDALRETYTDEFEGVKNTKDALAKLRGRMLDESRDTARTNANMAVLDRARSMAQSRFVELQRKLDQIDLYLKLGPTEIEGRLDTELPREAEKLSRIPRVLTMLAGPIAGLLLGFMLASLLDLGDRRLQSREAVLRHLDLDVLAALPRMSGSAAPPREVLP